MVATTIQICIIIRKFQELPPEGEYLGQFLLGKCRWPHRTPVPLQSILWQIIDSIQSLLGKDVTCAIPTQSLSICMGTLYRLNKEHYLSATVQTVWYNYKISFTNKMKNVTLHTAAAPAIRSTVKTWCLVYFFSIAYFFKLFLVASLSENCSLLGTDNNR